MGFMKELVVLVWSKNAFCCYLFVYVFPAKLLRTILYPTLSWYYINYSNSLRVRRKLSSGRDRYGSSLALALLAKNHDKHIHMYGVFNTGERKNRKPC